MRTMLVITGITDGYGLGKLHEILTKRFVAARRGAGILRTHDNMPDIYQLDLADGSQLVVIRPDSSADTRHFVVTVVTESQAFADQVRRDFTAPSVDVNLKNICVQVLGNVPVTDAERKADSADRFTPKLVDLSPLGDDITITFLLGGSYYTAERIRPDFTGVADDAELWLAESSAEATLQAWRQQVVGQSQETRCEHNLIDMLLANGRIAFGVEFQAYLRHNRLEDAEPTNKSYYEAKKTFMTVWRRLSALISEA